MNLKNQTECHQPQVQLYQQCHVLAKHKGISTQVFEHLIVELLLWQIVQNYLQIQNLLKMTVSDRCGLIKKKD